MIDRKPFQLNKTFIILTGLVVCGLGVAGLVHPAFPLVAGALLLVFAIVKSRLVIDDFLGLRDRPGGLRTALTIWPLLFAIAALLRAVFFAPAFI